MVMTYKNGRSIKPVSIMETYDGNVTVVAACDRGGRHLIIRELAKEYAERLDNPKARWNAKELDAVRAAALLLLDHVETRMSFEGDRDAAGAAGGGAPVATGQSSPWPI